MQQILVRASRDRLEGPPLIDGENALGKIAAFAAQLSPSTILFVPDSFDSDLEISKGRGDLPRLLKMPYL